MPYAPIILFTYNRPNHTRQTLESLSLNTISAQSQIYIYQDAPKTESSNEERKAIGEVKSYIQSFIKENNKKPIFKTITFIERENNLGLADSIIDGVSYVMKKHGKAIILEDDIIVSPVFLDYMNESLIRYENQQKVWCIAAWSYPIQTQGLGDCYFWRSPHCWGWGSWISRWQYYKRDISWALENFSQSDIDYINIEGNAHFFDQLIGNAKGKIKTWAIFNYLIAYKHNALTLCPSLSYIRQIGFDGSGVHCSKEGEVFNPSYINTKFPISYPIEIKESQLALERIKVFERSLKKPLPIRAYNKFIRISQMLKNKLSILANRGGGSR